MSEHEARVIELRRDGGFSRELAEVMADAEIADESLNQWMAEGQELAAEAGALQWAIGDWWAHGEHAYGDRAKAGALLFDGQFAYGTLCNMGSVARAIEPSRRRELLSWSHHVEVAKLDPHDQDMWLASAEEKRWSVKRLRREVRGYGSRDTGKPAKPRQPAADDPIEPESVSAAEYLRCLREILTEQIVSHICEDGGRYELAFLMLDVLGWEADAPRRRLHGAVHEPTAHDSPSRCGG
jgi:hypothetical protein